MWLAVLKWLKDAREWLFEIAAGLVAALVLVLYVGTKRRAAEEAAKRAEEERQKAELARQQAKTAADLVALHNKREDDLRAVKSVEAVQQTAIIAENKAVKQQLAEKGEELDAAGEDAKKAAEAINHSRGVP